ncbi:MAG: sigma 54-interacting transcriptional regulator [Deltaproteobacteria bacterium]|nr:sigma 54-interacting transcriptional regulator [Deltaproteobacteria bacterium]
MPGSTDTGTRILSGDEPLRPSVQRFLLGVIRGPQPGSTHLLLKDRTTLGKGEDADVVIADATVSRLHLEIVRSGDRYMVRDLGSTNGTFLEGTQIKEAFLKPGSRIRAGEVLLRFLPVNEVVTAGPIDFKNFGDLLGTSVKTREAFALLHKISPTEATVLLLGETGTGKSAAARAIHAGSQRKDGPFVVLDCGAISKSLIESELFGHEKGAFTGAAHTRQGAMEACRGGTLFIDELDDLPIEVQPKLLRALEEREIYRVGSHRPIHLDLRVIAATKKDLRKEVQEGRFREDLFFRVSVVMVPIPPLRERREDIPLLVDHFLGKPGTFDGLRSEIQERLLSHTWPGNIRELRNVLERASYTGELDDFDPGSRRTPLEDPDAKLVVDHTRPFKEAKEALVSRFEREYLRQLLQRTKGNMARAAREAGIDRKYLYMLQKKYGLGSEEAAEE